METAMQVLEPMTRETFVMYERSGRNGSRGYVDEFLTFSGKYLPNSRKVSITQHGVFVSVGGRRCQGFLNPDGNTDLPIVDQIRDIRFRKIGYDYIF